MKKGQLYLLQLTFFGLTQEYKLFLYEQLFDLCYYSQGAFTFSEVYSLPIYLRNFYYKKLADIKKKENESYEKANKSSSKSKIAKPF